MSGFLRWCILEFWNGAHSMIWLQGSAILSCDLLRSTYAGYEFFIANGALKVFL